MAEARNEFMENLQIGNPVKLPGSELNISNSVRIGVDIEANINKGRIQGKDSEMWADWLVKDVKEFDDIKDSKLQMKIRLLARRGDTSVNSDHLMKIHNEIDQMVEEGLDLSEAALWMGRVEDRHELLVANEENTPSVVTVAHDKESVPARDQPLYMGAVFRGGQNESYLVSPELVVRLDPEKQSDRRKFAYRNLYAFNSLYLKNARMNSGWLNATQSYETDLRVAKEKGARITSAELESSNEFLKAAMGVTASARALEISGGSFEDYAKILTGGNEKGSPNIGWQDENDAYLLHADPNKIIILLNDPLIKGYYDRLMKDLGIEQNLESEWHGDKKQTPRKITVDIEKINTEPSGVVHHVKDEAKQGGLDAYIDKVLVNEVITTETDTRVTRAAAKLACDIFLVDKWTEYFDIVNKSNMDDKPSKLQPISKGWGGDPFDFVIHPTGLQRLKSVYKNSASIVLEMLDSAFRPVDIYETIKDLYKEEKGEDLPPVIRLPVASAVTNIKTFNRQSQMINRITGGPMAQNLSLWGGPALSDLLEAERLCAQVLGTQEVDGEIGRDIAGAQIIRILEAKILASTLETKPPDRGDALKIAFDPDAKTRPLYEARSFLLGPEFNYKQGHLQALQGGDVSFTIADNPFAEDNYNDLIGMLRSNDQTGTLDAVALQRIGSLIRMGNSIANALNLVGGR